MSDILKSNIEKSQNTTEALLQLLQEKVNIRLDNMLDMITGSYELSEFGKGLDQDNINKLLEILGNYGIKN